MQVYLPIAEMAVSPFFLLGVGVVVGVLSGMFGIGGGFLLTPTLIFMGVPAPVAVASQTAQVCATSLTGAVSHWRRGAVDVRLGLILLLGGFAGSGVGVWAFRQFQAAGSIDVVISLSYVTFLTLIGGFMLSESLASARRTRARAGQRRQWAAFKVLPLKVRLVRSGLYVSILPILGIGFVVGVLAAIMGVGGGFLLAPAMVYLLKVPTRVMVGTSLFQVVFLTAFTACLHALSGGGVDLLLAGILAVGGVVGAEIGARLGFRLRPERLRLILALLVLGIGAKLLFDLVAVPATPFVVTEEP